MNAETPKNNPGPVEPIELDVSPLVFEAPGPGALLVSGGGMARLEFTRDGERWFPMGAHYGLFPLAAGDRMRLTFVDPAPANVVFVPM